MKTAAAATKSRPTPHPERMILWGDLLHLNANLLLLRDNGCSVYVVKEDQTDTNYELEEGTNGEKGGRKKAVRTRAKMKENDGANEWLGAIAEYQRGLFHAQEYI